MENMLLSGAAILILASEIFYSDKENYKLYALTVLMLTIFGNNV